MSDIEFRPEFESVVNVANKNYTDLQNKPSINGHELEGDKSSSDLGIATKVSELENDENFQENVIETISVNDTPLVPEEKAVNINVPVNVSELENDAEYITDDDVPVKSISVNSTPVEPDEDGNVDIPVPELPTPSTSNKQKIVYVNNDGKYALKTLNPSIGDTKPDDTWGMVTISSNGTPSYQGTPLTSKISDYKNGYDLLYLSIVDNKTGDGGLQFDIPCSGRFDRNNYFWQFVVDVSGTPTIRRLIYNSSNNTFTFL